jgi:hypothetical protein
MAYGINTTFRQIGIATSVAALGSIFATKLIGTTPTTVAAHYATALNELLLITAILALTAGLITMLLVRQKDFVHHDAPTVEPAPEQEAKTTQLVLTNTD